MTEQDAVKKWNHCVSVLVLLGVCCALIFWPLGAHALTDSQEAEIAHLLTFVRQSDCQFKRNGSWHNSEEAAQHIDRKYRYVLARGAVSSTEDFIRYAATESSWTGIDYTVQCPDQPEQPSAAWLTNALRLFRSGR